MKKTPERLQKTALSVTNWVGSPQSILAHTLVFVGSFLAVYFGALELDRMLLVLTTIVSLEAIYLAIFIQMSLNAQKEALEEVEQDIDEIQEDIDEIQEDVDEIQEDFEEMSEEDKEEEARETQDHRTLEEIHKGLSKLMSDVEKLQQR